MTFFDRHGFFREPELLDAPRPPDVSPAMRWYPVVTMMQMAMDTSLSMSAPMGFGHVYAPSHYINAWLEVTGIDDWSPEDVARLRATWMSAGPKSCPRMAARDRGRLNVDGLAWTGTLSTSRPC